MYARMFSIRRSDGDELSSEELICDRCGRGLSVAVEFEDDAGKPRRVGRDCAKYFGIVWTPAVGPMADDPEMYHKAVAIHTARKAPRYEWPGGWTVCEQVKEALGTIAWKRAASEAMRKR